MFMETLIIKSLIIRTRSALPYRPDSSGSGDKGISKNRDARAGLGCPPIFDHHERLKNVSKEEIAFSLCDEKNSMQGIFQHPD